MCGLAYGVKVHEVGLDLFSSWLGDLLENPPGSPMDGAPSSVMGKGLRAKCMFYYRADAPPNMKLSWVDQGSDLLCQY